jgi:hypothetical protein
MKFSLEQAKKAGLPKGAHFCDYLWFMDADQVCGVVDELTTKTDTAQHTCSTKRVVA